MPMPPSPKPCFGKHWQAGVIVPLKVDLELAKYMNNRGAGKLNFRKELEITDPSGAQNRF